MKEQEHHDKSHRWFQNWGGHCNWGSHSDRTEWGIATGDHMAVTCRWGGLSGWWEAQTVKNKRSPDPHEEQLKEVPEHIDLDSPVPQTIIVFQSET